MRDYLNPDWQGLLEQNGLAGFDALWDLKAEWFEEPNQRRGGWSGVARIELKDADGQIHGLFLKRQENHCRRSLSHPLQGEPTFAAEMRNILQTAEAGVPALEPVYYGQRRVGGKWRAILMTVELSGFCPLHELLQQWQDDGWSSAIAERRQLITKAAVVIRQLHQHRLVHNSLHPKHLFVRSTENGEPEIHLIDLEKMRQSLSFKQAARRDLDSFNRRARNFGSRTDRLRFLKAYLGTPVLTQEGKALWHYLGGRYRREYPGAG